MTRQTSSTSSVYSSNRNAPRPAIWLTILSLMVIISLGCNLFNRTIGQPGKPVWFEKKDCSVSSFPDITFPDITIDFTVDDIYNGPYLICNSSSPGAHGSVSYYISDIAYKTEKLNESYNELHTSIQGFVDQANEWNSALESGDPLIDTIDIRRNDSNRYVIVISSQSNVQHCYRGYGYGAEKVLGRYLVHIGFESCEKGDAAAYSTLMWMLEDTALEAIARVEGVSLDSVENP